MKKKICVVGAGYWGKNHIKTLNKLGVLGGVVDNDTKSLEYCKNLYPQLKTYRKIEKAFCNKELKGFVVSTPANTHFSIAKNIILNKKHLLVEKPLCLRSKDAKILVDLAKLNGVSLMVGHLLLFHPAIKKIKEYVDSGKIGNLQYIYSNRLNLGKIRNEENVFWSFAPHDISIFQFINGCSPNKIYSKGSAIIQKTIQDTTITVLKFPNGVDSHIFVSWLHPFKEHRLVVIGSEGMLTYEDSIYGKPLKFYKKKFNKRYKIPEKIDGPVEEIKYEKKMPLDEELKYFIKNMGTPKLKLSNGDHGLKVVEILEKVSKYINYEE